MITKSISLHIFIELLNRTQPLQTSTIIERLKFWLLIKINRTCSSEIVAQSMVFQHVILMVLTTNIVSSLGSLGGRLNPIEKKILSWV